MMVDEPPMRPEPHRHRWATLAVLCVTLLLISLDTTVLNVALPSIVRSLGASSSQLQWMVDAYAVVFAGLLLSLGALGDRVGRKWVFMGGLVVFGGGSALAAWSGSPDRLTLARAVMGIGAAALMPCTLSILTNVFTTERDRVRAIGIWSGATGLGVALGPIVGGFLLSRFWWGAVFLVNVPMAVAGLVAAIWLVPNSRNPASPRPDPLGAVLSMLGLALLLWGIIEAPNRGWSSPVIVGALVGAGIVIAAFVVWERRCDHPMLPLRFFANPRYSTAIAALALVLFALLGMFFLMTQYLQFVLGYSPLEAGVRIAPVALALLVIAPLSVILARRFGTKFVVATGMGLIAVGLGLLSRTTVVGTYADCIGPFVVLGVGVALGTGALHRIGDGVAPEGGGGRRFGHQRHRHAGGRSTGRGGPRHGPEPPLSRAVGTGGRPRRPARLDPATHRELARGGTGRGPARAHQGRGRSCRPGPARVRVGDGPGPRDRGPRWWPPPPSSSWPCSRTRHPAARSGRRSGGTK